ncbi:protein Wnt-5 isoform X2 [Sitodiplosis mosellana]|uniref:protein Wnt-5 isoform X2 n=1 Tax=Sitodiplosis mosellana TaxID=263140 RepID=UPI002444E86D|nr:protein Wnt-5 isoform X2 [Sitodiplosis mosellana]
MIRRCLGLKSPFIEFKPHHIEVLSNLSISLNTTDPSFGNNMMSGNSFSYAFEAAGNDTIQKQYLEMVKKQQKWMITSSSTENPVVMAAMNNKKEVTLIETKDDLDGKRSIDHIDRKYIIPLALKVATSTSSTSTTTTTTTRKPPVLPDTSPNIDDLKRHILMLQNLTKNDENFQSKFVVFPSLQRTSDALPLSTTPSTTTSTSFTTIYPIQSSSEQMPTTVRTTTTMRTTTKRATMTTKRRPSLNVPKQTWPITSKEESQKAEKITIVPQVFLQNDQTPMNDDSFERPPLDDAINYQRQSNSPQKFSYNDPKPTFLSSSTKRNQYASVSTEQKQKQKQQLQQQQQQHQPKKNANANRNKEKQLRREMRKKCKEAPLDQKQNCTKAFQISFNLTSAAAVAAIRNTKTDKNGEHQSINSNSNHGSSSSSSNTEIRSNSGSSRLKANYVPPYRSIQPPPPPSSSSHSVNTNKRPDRFDSEGGQEDDDALKQSILQRTIRSHRRHQRRNASAVINTMSRRDYPYSIGTPITTINETVSADVAAASYKEKIDLNPDLCYKITGLSYGQQKLCASNTQIMPAISRGARAAIQECKHQFKNRRWNCSTIDDNTVFGPISGLGSPEMAFVHAMAAAAAASFVARACRDGQLSTCGCSRSSRPRQLHSDWTWGGCGDDLQFGYKFSQQFIDIRENERKRSQRGVVSVPPKYTKLDDEKVTHNETNSNSTNGSTPIIPRPDNTPTGFKPEHLLELQEKITKEILSTKLGENEMHELQAKINHEILNSKVFNLENQGYYGNFKKNQRGGSTPSRNRYKSSASAKARSKMNIHNNEAGRRAMINKSRITCKCHGVSGSCSLITCWQQLTSIREIGDYLREKYDEATQVKLNKRGFLQVKDSRYKIPTANDLVYLDESPDWCRNTKQLQWPGTHNRVCNKTSSGLDGCAILCCGRGYNTKKIVVKERCNCKFHWCCHVKCETCTRVIEEHTCK